MKTVTINGKNYELGSSVKTEVNINGKKATLNLVLTPSLASEFADKVETPSVENLVVLMVKHYAAKVPTKNIHEDFSRFLCMMQTLCPPAFLRYMIRECSVIMRKYYGKKFNDTPNLYYIDVHLNIVQIKGLPSEDMCQFAGLFFTKEDAEKAIAVYRQAIAIYRQFNEPKDK